MFKNLSETELCLHYRLIPLDFPGFGLHSLQGETTLSALADFVLDHAKKSNTRSVLAHSLASITATLAAERSYGFIKNIVSLEGNLTAADAYFSGMAVQYESALEFKTSLASKILAVSTLSEHLRQRYSAIVLQANELALWQLGRDAYTFSQKNHPGERLRHAASCHYIYNPDNCPAETLQWLETAEIDATLLGGASHWATIDRPNDVSSAILNR